MLKYTHTRTHAYKKRWQCPKFYDAHKIDCFHKEDAGTNVCRCQRSNTVDEHTVAKCFNPQFYKPCCVIWDKRRFKIDETENDRGKDILRTSPEASVKRAARMSSLGVSLRQHILRNVSNIVPQCSWRGRKYLQSSHITFPKSGSRWPLTVYDATGTRNKCFLSPSQTLRKVHFYGTGWLDFPWLAITARQSDSLLTTDPSGNQLVQGAGLDSSCWLTENVFSAGTWQHGWVRIPRIVFFSPLSVYNHKCNLDRFFFLVNQTVLRLQK